MVALLESCGTACVNAQDLCARRVLAGAVGIFNSELRLDVDLLAIVSDKLDLYLPNTAQTNECHPQPWH